METHLPWVLKLSNSVSEKRKRSLDAWTAEVDKAGEIRNEDKRRRDCHACLISWHCFDPQWRKVMRPNMDRAISWDPLLRVNTSIFALRLRWQRISHSGKERHSLDDFPKQNVSLQLHHGLFTEHGKAVHLVGKLEFSSSAVTLGRGVCSTSEQMILTRGSHHRRGGNFERSEYMGPAAAILVHELPLKACLGHWGILSWDREDFSRELITLNKQMELRVRKLGLIWSHSHILRERFSDSNNLGSFIIK